MPADNARLGPPGLPAGPGGFAFRIHRSEMQRMSSFAELGAPEPLAAALAARGYHTPTPVQEAVQKADARDLLVSARTGSGKTVAFGLLLAKDLLPLPEAGKPLALGAAPTPQPAPQA